MFFIPPLNMIAVGFYWLVCLSFLLFLPNATAAPLEFPLDEKWFEDEMEQISDLLEQKKAKASR